MNIIYNSSQSTAAQTLADMVNNHSDDIYPLLLLLSGGSNIQTAVEAAPLITHDNVAISLIDERYGEVGHPDSNWQQLIEAGFPFERFVTEPVLIDETPDNTVDHFAEILHKYEDVIALFGMGTDGHVSGILHESPALDKTGSDVVTYEGFDFVRVTTTPQYLSSLETAVLCVIGQDKHEQLQRFISETLSVRQQPAQLLKNIPNLTVITDMEQS